MATGERERMMSQSSSSSSDSSCLLDTLDSDPPYATVQIGSSQNLSGKSGHGKGEESSSLRRREKSSSPLAVVSLVVSVVCLLTVAVSLALLIRFPRLFFGKLSDHCQEKVCMPCSQVNPNPLAEGQSPMLRQLDIHQDKDGLESEAVCCASTPAQYATLFKLVLERQEGVKKLADIIGVGNSSDSDDDNDTDIGGIRRKAVSAHLLIKPGTSPDFVDEQGHSLQQWKSPVESPMSHLRGLKFHNHKLYVKSPGFYFIYCQILFNRAPPPKDEDPNSKHLALLASHYVRRHSLLYPASSGLLLKARHTRVSGLDDRHSSYVGGLFYLHAGDQLFVQVSAPELVSRDDRASFFGLFKVGN